MQGCKTLYKCVCVKAVGEEGGCQWKRGGGTDGWMLVSKDNQEGTVEAVDTLACFHGNLPVKDVGTGNGLGAGGGYVSMCM